MTLLFPFTEQRHHLLTRKRFSRRWAWGESRTWTSLHAAAEDFAVPAELIASVLIDEHVRMDVWDVLQHVAIHFGLRLPGRLAAGWWRLLGWVCGRPVDSFSLGRAQMKPATLRRLGALRYLDVPFTEESVWRMLLDDRLAARLVAACLRATADHWAAEGVEVLHRPEILGTLYSLGLTGAKGVHPHPTATARGEGIARQASLLRTHGALSSRSLEEAV